MRDFLEVDLTEQGDCLALRVDRSGVPARAQSLAWGSVEGETAPEMGLEKSGNMGADAEMRGEFWETVGLPEGLLAPPGPGF